MEKIIDTLHVSCKYTYKQTPYFGREEVNDEDCKKLRILPKFSICDKFEKQLDNFHDALKTWAVGSKSEWNTGRN